MQIKLSLKIFNFLPKETIEKSPAKKKNRKKNLEKKLQARTGKKWKIKKNCA